MREIPVQLTARYVRQRHETTLINGSIRLIAKDSKISESTLGWLVNGGP